MPDRYHIDGNPVIKSISFWEGDNFITKTVGVDGALCIYVIFEFSRVFDGWIRVEFKNRRLEINPVNVAAIEYQTFEKSGEAE